MQHTMHETFDHTADLGLRVRAPDLTTLFSEAAAGLSAILVENPEAIVPRESMDFRVQGSEVEYLFFDWLSELLFAFDTRQLVFSKFDVRIHETGMECTARGEPLDIDRHGGNHDVKAITYHELQVTETDEGWLAEVILDL